MSPRITRRKTKQITDAILAEEEASSAPAPLPPPLPPLPPPGDYHTWRYDRFKDSYRMSRLISLNGRWNR